MLSHGHNDHTGGLSFLIDKYAYQGVKLIAHPDIFKSRTEGKIEIGYPLTEEKVKKVFDLKLSPTPIQISENLLFLGEIPVLNDFENKESIGFIKENNNQKYEDFVKV